MSQAQPQPGRLKRELGVFHAVLLGLGSILGTGVFVSIGIAAGIAGPSVLIAIVLAALLALCNGLSSAQLAAAHPVAGGTYEYGYKFLHPKLGFTAGWMFLLAKSASAATAALGAASYVYWEFLASTPFVETLQFEYGILFPTSILVLAELFVLGITALVLLGIRRSAWVNSILVLITIAGLILVITFVYAKIEMPTAGKRSFQNYDWQSLDKTALATATALMFVAYTGYGRIATLGEEVRNPRQTIPQAIVWTLVVTAALYFAIGLCVTYAIDTARPKFIDDTVLIELFYNNQGSKLLILLVTIAAITAMLGVLLNLVLGLSRVLLAMGRRHDVPSFFKNVNASGTTPVPAVIGVGILIAGLTLIGDVKTTWSFSAFTVLIYYGITNLAALRLPVEKRLYPRVFAWAGLGGCLFLCWFVEPIVWMIGLKLIAIGLLWHWLAPKMFDLPPRPTEVCTTCGYDLRASSEQCPECGAVIT